MAQELFPFKINASYILTLITYFYNMFTCLFAGCSEDGNLRITHLLGESQEFL